MMRSLLIVLTAALSFRVHGFSVTQFKKSRVLFASGESEPQKKGGFFANFFEELDAFVDDATSRRLGAGSAFYGKRKSNFYGASDKGRKMNRDMPDPTGELTKMWSFGLLSLFLFLLPTQLSSFRISAPQRTIKAPHNPVTSSGCQMRMDS
jgi:hypothetical protein